MSTENPYQSPQLEPPSEPDPPREGIRNMSSRDLLAIALACIAAAIMLLRGLLFK